jgi:hypothetical protein
MLKKFAILLVKETRKEKFIKLLKTSIVLTNTKNLIGLARQPWEEKDHFTFLLALLLRTHKESRYDAL